MKHIAEYLLPILIIVTLILPCACAKPAPTQIEELGELRYDDGTSDGSWAIGGPGRGHLVHFPPPTTPFTIKGTKIYGNLGGTGHEDRKFKVEIWDEDLKVLYACKESYAKFNLAPRWVVIDTPDIVVDGDFYIFVCTDSPKEGGIHIHYDSSRVNRHSEVTEYGKIADWYLQTPREKVTWMIRVIGSATAIPKSVRPSEKRDVIQSVTLGKRPVREKGGWAGIIPTITFVAGQDLMGMEITLSSDIENEVVLSSVKLVSKETGEASPLDEGLKLKPGKNNIGYWSITRPPGKYEVRFYIDDTVIFVAPLQLQPFSEAGVEELACRIHENAWIKVVSTAQMDDYYKYAIYASRTLAVKHPEVYLQGDDIFVKAITTNPGFKKAYETKDVHSDYLSGKQPEGPPFSFDDVEFDEYALISAKETYPDYYPILPFLDRRLAPIATSLKAFDNRITQLEKAEQLYFKERLAGYNDLYLIYCDNENAYLYRDGLLLSARNEAEIKDVEGNPILIFNEGWTWYPLMDRDDTKESGTLQELVSKYSTEIDEPVLSDFERDLIGQLKKVTEVETEKGLAFLKLVSIHSNSKTREFLPKELKQQFKEMGLPCIPTRAMNEKMNLISPISAYLAAIAKQVEGAGGTKTLCDEYLKYAATPDQAWWAHGHAWFCGMIECGIDYSYRTHAGHCSVQAANIGAVLELADVDRYRMAGFTFWKEGWGGHDFIYIPGQDLIVSNGKIEDLQNTVIDYADDRHRKSPFKYLHFIELGGKWAWIGAHYHSGTLSPNEVLEILTYLRGIHGDDIQSGKIVNNELMPAPFDELSRNLKDEQKTWKPRNLPPLITTSLTLPDFLRPNARKLYTFEQIVLLLDTPDKVSVFMRNNIEWDGKYDIETAGINEYVPAWMVYERGIDDCDGHATLQAYFLKANGYDAWNVGIGIGGPKGHNVCVYLDNGLYWILDNCGVKKGPFKSLDELGDSIIPGASITLFDPFDIASPVRGSAFSLPHTVYRQ